MGVISDIAGKVAMGTRAVRIREAGGTIGRAGGKGAGRTRAGRSSLRTRVGRSSLRTRAGRRTGAGRSSLRTWARAGMSSLRTRARAGMPVSRLRVARRPGQQSKATWN